MRSTGNDIVAFNLTDQRRTIKPGFHSKILSLSEKELYDRHLLQAMSFHQYVWLLWSVKEAAFKFLKRISPDLIFSPVKIIVREIYPAPHTLVPVTNAGLDTCSECYSGALNFNGEELFFQSKLTMDWVSSIVNDSKDFSHIRWGISLIDNSTTETQSREARTLVVNELNDILPGENLHITKSAAGYPVVIKDGCELNIPLSIAHHHNLVGYSFVVPELTCLKWCHVN